MLNEMDGPPPSPYTPLRRKDIHIFGSAATAASPISRSLAPAAQHAEMVDAHTALQLGCKCGHQDQCPIPAGIWWIPHQNFQHVISQTPIRRELCSVVDVRSPIPALGFDKTRNEGTYCIRGIARKETSELECD